MIQALSRAQVRRLDAIAIEELGIPGVVLMENAGRGAAEIIAAIFRERGASRVVVFCGAGNNGGDGFVIARHLSNAGLVVRVYLTAAESTLRGDAAINYRVLCNMKADIEVIDNRERMKAATDGLTGQDFVVDALLGTGFQGEVRPPLADLIRGINAAAQCFTVAIDVPSGLDCDSGMPGGVAVRADVTITFVAPKVGFLRPDSLEWTGAVRVVGIGTPPSLMTRVLREEPS